MGQYSLSIAILLPQPCVLLALKTEVFGGKQVVISPRVRYWRCVKEASVCVVDSLLNKVPGGFLDSCDGLAFKAEAAAPIGDCIN